MISDITISVTGLGYVGLPIAMAFAKQRRVIGLDTSASRIADLKVGYDKNREIPKALFQDARIAFTTDVADLKAANIHIVTVPTPIDAARNPDLSLMIGASVAIGSVLQKGALVIYESTVYPGVTEECCIPVLEKHSGLKAGKDFFVGYSPERINPGDGAHGFSKVVKVVSGQTPEIAERVAVLYREVVSAGVYVAESIKVAEAAKVIENTQRDLNIALMNELAIICSKMDIDTHQVLRAAKTKWNFLNFEPGLVGGHCIGVDPYYLTYKAEMLGYHPEVILAGRRINDNMGKFIAEQTIKKMIHKGLTVKGAKIAMLGLTFKEDCPDLRNSKVMDVVNELKSYGVEVLVHDPIANADDAEHEYGVRLLPWKQIQDCEALILAVKHREYRELHHHHFQDVLKEGALIVDIKGILDAEMLTQAGYAFWRL